jgi:hypothetical protein
MLIVDIITLITNAKYQSYLCFRSTNRVITEAEIV